MAEMMDSRRRVRPCAPRAAIGLGFLVPLTLATAGALAGEVQVIDIRAPSAPPSDYRAKWAVIIGIDAYPGGASGLEPLLFAANDAREVHDILRDEFGFSEMRIHYLSDQQATRQAIRDAFQCWLPGREPGEDDCILVFFSGHGLIDPETNEGYLAGIDSRASDLAGTCIPVSWIRKILAEHPKLGGRRHKLVILDSCYSGALFQEEPARNADDHRADGAATGKGAKPRRGEPGQRGPGPVPNTTNLAYLLKRPFFWGISAGRFTPVADGLGKRRHSVFTAALLQELLDRADTPREDQIFTFRRLAERVETRVTNALNSRQIPDWDRLGPGDGDFLFHPTLYRVTPSEVSAARQYARTIVDVAGAWEAADIKLATQLLDNLRPAPGEEDLRGFEWDYWWRRTHGELRSLTGHAGGINAVAYNRTGERIATASSDKTVKVWDTAKGRELQTFRAHSQEVTALAVGVQCPITPLERWERWEREKGAVVRPGGPQSIGSGNPAR